MSSTGKSKGAVNSLTSAASGLTPAKLLPQRLSVLANCAYHNRSFTSKAAMCACIPVTIMSLPCCFTLGAFRCIVMSVSRARRASHRGSITDQRGKDSSDDERWRSPSASRTHGTAWLLGSASELRKSKANRRTARQPVPGT